MEHSVYLPKNELPHRSENIEMKENRNIID